VSLTYLEEGRDAFFSQALLSDPSYVRRHRQVAVRRCAGLTREWRGGDL